MVIAHLYVTPMSGWFLYTSYDNDGKGVHPYVMLLENDGTKKFNHEHEHGVHKEKVSSLLCSLIFSLLC